MIITSHELKMAAQRRPRTESGAVGPIAGLPREMVWHEEQLLDLTPTQICNLPGVTLTRQQLIDRLNDGMTIREAIGK